MATTDFNSEQLYEPLDAIRLLRLPWGKDPSKFDSYLVSYALNSASCPDFIALSYTWGDSTHTTPINVNGHPFAVRSNLHSFLRLVPGLGEFSSETWWWIDSICIDQNNEKEKSNQMQIMGKIYERARKTIVWLGGEYDPSFGDKSGDCRHAIDNLYRLCEEKDKCINDDLTLDKPKLLALRDR